MALIHRADLSPSKLDLLATWLPTRSWYNGPDLPALERVAAGRFDDPNGEVGIETILVRVGDGPVLQAPLTYRAAPLDGAERWLIGTTEHSVLGTRWVYDACGDPVYAAALAETILGAGREADELVQIAPDRLEPRPPGMSLVGTGSGNASGTVKVTVLLDVDDSDPTVMSTDSVVLVVARVVDATDVPGVPALTGSWSGQPTPMVLAWVRPL